MGVSHEGGGSWEPLGICRDYWESMGVPRILWGLSLTKSHLQGLTSGFAGFGGLVQGS